MIPPIGPRDGSVKPHFDTHQTDSAFYISIYTKRLNVGRDNVLAEISQHDELGIRLSFPEDGTLYSVQVRLHHEAQLDQIKVSPRSGKVEISLLKGYMSKWPNLGEPMQDNDVLRRQSEASPKYRSWIIKNRTAVTHDTDHIELEPMLDSEVASFGSISVA